MDIKWLGSNTPLEKRRFVHSIMFPLFFLFVISSIHLFQCVEGVSFTKLGVYPLHKEGLWGVLFAPLIHGDWKHLYSNAVSMLILGSTLFYFYNKIAYKIFFLIYFLCGIGTWLAARESWHIGASGVIYGLTTFIVLSGLLRKHISLIAISLFVILFYGGLIWGAFPLKVDLPYSWEGHLWGAISGIFIAIIYRHEGPQKPESPFHNENDEEADETEFPYWLAETTQEKSPDIPDDNAEDNLV